MTDVKRLLEQATPLPWGDPDDIHYGDFGWYVPDCPLGETEDSERGRADMSLAVHAVNSLPAYEAVADALERLCHYSDAAADCEPWKDGCDHRPWLRKETDTARAALSRLRGEK